MLPLSITGVTMEKATLWSITDFNEEYKTAVLPSGWKLEGQLEKCPDTGKEHYQGALKTPQCRFSAIKKIFPKAHIEICRDRNKLLNYVHKTETRIQEVETKVSEIPTVWDYSRSIAEKWNESDFKEFLKNISDEDISKTSMGEIALRYVDTIVSQDIKNGMRGVEFIAINPMFRSAWKKFYRALVYRDARPTQTIPQDANQEAVEETSETIEASEACCKQVD